MTDIDAEPVEDAPLERFRLRAVDGEDLAVIAACLQGALSCYGEMGFDEVENRFALNAALDPKKDFIERMILPGEKNGFTSDSLGNKVRSS